MKNIFRTVAISVGSMIIAAVGLNATDNLSNLSDSLLGSVLGIEEAGPCPDDMTYVPFPTGSFCIDTYEVSAADTCTHVVPTSEEQSSANLARPECVPVSAPERTPWTGITHTQAIQACGKVGKFVPTNEQWFAAAQGTPDRSGGWGRDGCNLNGNWGGGNPGKTGSGAQCLSSHGAYDMIGNVWEWTFETIPLGEYHGRTLPTTGYVAAVDESGMAISTDDSVQYAYNEDYAWTNTDIVAGVFRGGYYQSGTDGGLFALHAEASPSFAGAAVGFRCAREVQ